VEKILGDEAGKTASDKLQVQSEKVSD